VVAEDIHGSDALVSSSGSSQEAGYDSGPFYIFLKNYLLNSSRNIEDHIQATKCLNVIQKVLHMFKECLV
jgi:hypothetical protein